jgi:hypothetical protein
VSAGQGYLTAIFGRVKAGDADEIIEYMKWVATEPMGLSFDKARAKQAADAMLEWKRVIDSRS